MAAQDDTGATTAAAAAASTSASSSTDDAKARREARKARILNAGNDRLKRITKTGRGDEADTLYAQAAAAPSSAPPPPPTTTTTTASKTTATTSSATQEDRLESFLGEDGAENQNATAAVGGGLPLPRQQPQNLQEMFAALQAAIASQSAASAGAAGGGAQGGAAAAATGMPNLPFDLSAILSGLAGGVGGDGAAPTGGAPPPPPFGGVGTATATTSAGVPRATTTTTTTTTTRGALDKAFDLVRLLLFVLFGLSLVNGVLHHQSPANAPTAAVSTSSALRGHADDPLQLSLRRAEHQSSLERWARLAYQRPDASVAVHFGTDALGLPFGGVPVFWLFITLEVVLQSTRIMVLRRRPAPPSLLRKALPFLPPTLATTLLTLASYASLLNALVNDVAVVVFCVGMAVMWANWRVGGSGAGGGGAGGAGGVVGSVGDALGKAAEAVQGGTRQAAAQALAWNGDAPPAPLQGAL